MASIWEELKRRNVIKIAIAHAIVAWGFTSLSTVAQTDGTFGFRATERTWSSRIVPDSLLDPDAEDFATLLTCYAAQQALDRELRYFRIDDSTGATRVDYFETPPGGAQVITPTTLSDFSDPANEDTDGVIDAEPFARQCVTASADRARQTAFRETDRWGSSRIEVDQTLDYRNLNAAAELVCHGAQYALDLGFRYYRVNHPRLSNRIGSVEYFDGPPPGYQVLGARPGSDGVVALRSPTGAVIDAVWFDETCNRSANDSLDSLYSTITLPVRVHLLTLEATPELTSNLPSADIVELFDGVNAIWEQVGIRWALESIVQEEAIATYQRDMRLALNSGFVRRDMRRRGLPEIVADLCPTKAWLDRGWNICVMSQFPDSELNTLSVNDRRICTGWFITDELEFEPQRIAMYLGWSLGARIRPGRSPIEELTEEQIQRTRNQTRNRSLGSPLNWSTANVELEVRPRC